MTEHYLKFEDLVDANYGKITNDITYARNTPNPGTQKFTYTKPCDKPSVEWGGNKPVNESCLPYNLQMGDDSCNNIWNNSTKRKTIVNVGYNYPK